MPRAMVNQCRSTGVAIPRIFRLPKGKARRLRRAATLLRRETCNPSVSLAFDCSLYTREPLQCRSIKAVPRFSSLRDYIHIRAKNPTPFGAWDCFTLLWRRRGYLQLRSGSSWADRQRPWGCSGRIRRRAPAPYQCRFPYRQRCPYPSGRR